MFQIRSLVSLKFFLLILRFFFNLTLDIIYKCNRFFKAFLKKNFKFVLYKNNNLILFNLSLILLLVKIDFFLK